MDDYVSSLSHRELAVIVGFLETANGMVVAATEHARRLRQQRRGA